MTTWPRYKSSPRALSAVRRVNFNKDLVDIPCYEIEVEGRTIRYSSANDSPFIYGRVATIFAKEPTTIPYIETFGADDVFLDIGANIGLYSIYAAKYGGCRVYCIEPEALNFAQLNTNIYVNGLNDRVTAFCAAAADEVRVGELLLGAFAIGYSHHDFGESSWTGDMRWSADVLTRKDARIRQGSIAVTVDHLVETLAIKPTHIKIDVDGHESKVIAGMAKTLQSPELRTVLVEIDFKLAKSQEIIDQMVNAGWRYSMDQLITNRNMVMKPERVQELRALGKDGFNYIFFRDEAYAAYFREFLDVYIPPLDARGKMVSAPKRIG